jgi:hypothetical protein
VVAAVVAVVVVLVEEVEMMMMKVKEVVFVVVVWLAIDSFVEQLGKLLLAWLLSLFGMLLFGPCLDFDELQFALLFHSHEFFEWW